MCPIKLGSKGKQIDKSKQKASSIFSALPTYPGRCNDWVGRIAL